ncbi:hypothetical protein [Nocardiopsis sp. NPDC057823]|uniref:hypothetical protein n=1 Tax=Nocardiopsis sp. NPDC057823 TaxID=3346256 RepID=UPI00366B31E0
MVKPLSWNHYRQGGIDGLILFRVTGHNYDRPPFTLHTSLPVGGSRWNSYKGQNVALTDLSTEKAAQAKAQEVLEQFTATLEDGTITWTSGGPVRPTVGVVGGMNLFRIQRLPGRVLLRSRLPIAPGGVAQGDLANVDAAKVKAAQMMEQFAHHVGLVYRPTS